MLIIQFLFFENLLDRSSGRKVKDGLADAMASPNRLAFEPLDHSANLNLRYFSNLSLHSLHSLHRSSQVTDNQSIKDASRMQGVQAEAVGCKKDATGMQRDLHSFGLINN